MNILREQTINKAQTGDQQAYNQLVSYWHPRIYQFALKYFSSNPQRVAPHDLAMEVSQKTFISVHRNLAKLQDTGKFHSWLYRIALNYCYEEDRKRKRNPVTAFGEMGFRQEKEVRNTYQSNTPGPHATALAQDKHNWIYKALNQLPEEQRVVIIMKEFEGLKFREIAESLNISENTAKSRLYYGLHAMKKIFTAWNLDKETMLYE